MRHFALTAVAALFAVSANAGPAASPISGQFVSPELTDFDAGRQAGQASVASLSAALQSYRSRFGYTSHVDQHLGTTFLWAPKGTRSASKPSSLSGAALIDARARDHLQRNASVLGLSAVSIREASLFDSHDLGEGPVIARYQQRVGGVEVFGREINVMTDRSGRLVAISGYFAPSADQNAASAGRYALSAPKAISRAFADMGGKVSEAFVGGKAKGGYVSYQRPAAEGDLQLEADPRAKKVLFAQGAALVPAYYIELAAATRDAGRQANFGYVISAADGSVLFRHNQMDHAVEFSYRMFADDTAVARPFDSPLGNARAPFRFSSPAQTGPRKPATANLVSLSSSAAISTADPWLADTAKTTAGNNVVAYLDLLAPDGYTKGFDVQPKTTAANVFDYPLVGDGDPNTVDAKNAAVVNLFYMNNYLHDLWYDRGFNESARNAQVDNYSRGGIGNDPILAEGQDYSGRSNANMSTPADGGSPRMQMYLFDGLVKGEVTITAPAEIQGSLEFAAAAFGARTTDITNQVVLVDDGVAPNSDACTAPVNGAALAGKIALIDRGGCTFVIKVKFAQQAGAIGAIVANNVAGSPIAMGGTDATITIPAMMITMDDGTKIKGASSPVTVHMRRDAVADLDGTLDEGIIAHEFFHYVSNRLVGNANGLSNNQGRGMGEGWSDFSAMVLQVRGSDAKVPTNADWAGAYPVGEYVTGKEYFGIRRAPYSTDMAKNPLTFKHIQNGVALPAGIPYAFGQDGASNAEVHNTGEVWCNVLWEAYAGFLKDGRYNASHAMQKVQSYVVAGLKMTPNAPTLLEARDGILASADATNDADFTIWATAFAKRGMGVGAIAPNRNSTTNVGVTESYVVASPTP